jgi:Domain of unknown function (DUF4173)
MPTSDPPALPLSTGMPRARPPAVVAPRVDLGAVLRRWPVPAGGAAPAVLAAAAATGVVAALFLPVDRPGLGWLVTGLTAVAALVAARAGRLSRDGALWAAATVLLLGVGTVRAAGWLFALCLLAATVTASLALTRGSGAGALATRAVALLAGGLRAPGWARRGLARAPANRATVLRRLATAVVSLALLVVFGALFVSADAAFADAVGRLLPDGTGVGRTLLLVVAGTVVVAAAAVLAAPPDLSGLGRAPVRRLRREEWLLPALTLVALFVAFVAVQAAVLFGGRAHVLGAGGPTYAGYARGGFWQLLVVTALTLAVLAAAARWVPRATAADRTLVRAVLGPLTALTLVIVASALARMATYEQAYGFTRLRLLVSVCELWLGVVLLLVLVAGVRLRARRLPEAAVAAAVAALLGLAILNPDRFIADRNVDRYETTGRIDTGYLSRLSADAVPALDRLPAGVRACALPDLPRPDGLREWNLGRARARAAYVPATCLPGTGR